MEGKERKQDRLEKMFKAVFGNHTDAENSEALPNREEIDKNVEKMLKMLRTDDNGPILSENSFDKSELASFIDDFHKGYQAVHGRYDHLMGNLKKKIQRKSSDNGSFSIDFASTSSDSEDSDSGSDSDKKKKLSKVKEGKAGHVSLEDYQNLQGQLEDMKIKNNELETRAIEVSAKLQEKQTLAAELAGSARLLQAELAVVKKELEASLKKEDDMNQKMRILNEVNEFLRSENAEAFRRIHEADKSIEEFQIELNKIKDEMEKCKSENSILKDEAGKTSNEVASLNQQLMSVTKEKEALRSGNFVFLKRVQEAEKALAALRDVADQKLKLVTEEFTSQKANLSSENESLKLRLEAAAQQETDMTHRLSAAEEEISSLKSEILRSSTLIQEAEKTIGDLSTESGLHRDENLKLLNNNNDLNQQLEVKVAEIEALTSERLECVEALRKAEEKTSMLSVEIETLKDENSNLLVNYDKMIQELEETNDKVSELKRTLVLTEDEKQTLAAENSELLNRIQQAEEAIDDLKTETEKQGDDKSQLQIKINELGLKLEAANSQLSDLNEDLSAAKEEKNALALEISGVMIKLQQSESNEKELEIELERSREEISMLQQYQMKFQEAEKIIDDLKAEIEQLRADNSELKTNISDLGTELEVSNLQLTDLNKTLVSSEEEKKTLASETSVVTSKLQQAETKVEKLENDVMQMTKENSILENNHNELQQEKIYLTEKLREKEKEIGNLQEDCKELLEKLELMETEKADEDRENAKLSKKVQTLEVQLRLSSQKLKITETESKEKVEGCMWTMEIMKEERRVIEEQMLKLSQKMNFLETEVQQLKEAAESVMSGLAKGYHELEAGFERNSGHILKQLSSCTEELKALKKWIAELRDEKQELTVRLKYKEGIMSMMKDESESTADKLAKKDKELAVLRAHAIECEERMKVLEEMLREKKREVSDKDEAKREVIRQLCLLIEYHHENNDHLCKYLSSVLKRSGRSSS